MVTAARHAPRLETLVLRSAPLRCAACLEAGARCLPAPAHDKFASLLMSVPFSVITGYEFVMGSSMASSPALRPACSRPSPSPMPPSYIRACHRPCRSTMQRRHSVTSRRSSTSSLILSRRATISLSVCKHQRALALASPIFSVTRQPFLSVVSVSVLSFLSFVAYTLAKVQFQDAEPEKEDRVSNVSLLSSRISPHLFIIIPLLEAIRCIL